MTALLDTYKITPTTYGYTLEGKRGAVYGLFRNQKDKSFLFPISVRGQLPNNLRGRWFTDRNGTVEPLRAV